MIEMYSRESIKTLVVGAGGLGCELLRCMAMSGIINIDIIDMDTIELTNLNRQLLFTKEDINKPKAHVAATKILSIYPSCRIQSYYKKLQDMDQNFYRKFNVILCGLDSLSARRFINSMVVSLVEFNYDQTPKLSTIIPIIDGGTEGFKGHVRIIIPYITGCIDCNLDLFPPQIKFAICSVTNNPRQSFHCIEYARQLSWSKQQPFGENVILDPNNCEHIQWLYEEALEIANNFNIKGVTKQLTKDVIKNIIPAVASTQSVVASKCVIELHKLIQKKSLIGTQNFTNYNLSNGFHCYMFNDNKNENCYTCGRSMATLTLNKNETLQHFVDYLENDPKYQLESPDITCEKNGHLIAIIMHNPRCLYIKTLPNLKKTIKQLNIEYGHLIVTAKNLVKELHFYIQYKQTKEA